MAVAVSTTPRTRVSEASTPSQQVHAADKPVAAAHTGERIVRPSAVVFVSGALPEPMRRWIWNPLNAARLARRDIYTGAAGSL